jgi:hypothetical protein
MTHSKAVVVVVVVVVVWDEETSPFVFIRSQVFVCVTVVIGLLARRNRSYGKRCRRKSSRRRRVQRRRWIKCRGGEK